MSTIIKKLFLLFLFILIGCSQTNEYISKSKICMDTIITITLPKNIKDVNKKIKKLFDITDKYNAKYSITKKTSLIYKLNKLRKINYDSELYEILKTAEFYNNLTDGYFNIAVKTISQNWIFNNKTIYKLPKKIIYNKNFLTPDNIIINKKNIFFKNNIIKIDGGGIIKGFIVDKLVEQCKKWKIKNGIINAGGDLVVIGNNHGKKWKIGIQNPNLKDKKNPIIKKVKLTNSAIATSGNYERFVIFKNKRYCHIFNPYKYLPANYFSSVTVIADSLIKADILATAIFASENNYKTIINKIKKFDKNIKIFFYFH